MSRIILLSLFFFSCSYAFSQDWDWAERFGGSVTDGVQAMALSPDGDIVLAGSFQGQIDFGTISLQALGVGDAYLAKMDNNGQVQWAVSGGSASNDITTDIAVDPAGNILWLGQYWIEGFFGGDSIFSGGNSKAYFLAKYNPAGMLLWVQNIKGTSTKVVNGLTVGPSGSIFLTGYFSDSLTIDTSTIIASAEEDAFIWALSSDGTVNWGQRYGDSGVIRPALMNQLSNGDLVIAGEITGSVTFGDDLLISVNTDFDVFVARLDTLGEPTWGRLGTGVFDNFMNTMAIDDEDHIYLSGHFTGVLTIDGASIATPGFVNNLYVLKLESSGNLSWARALNEQVFNEPSFSFDIEVRNDLVYMTGQFLNELIIDDLMLSGGTDYKGFVAAFGTSNGTVQQLLPLSGSATTSGSQIMAGEEGEILVAGVFVETISFDDLVLASEGGTDIFVAQLNAGFTSILPLLPELKGQVKIHPNPVRDQLHLSLNGRSFKIEVLDRLGRVQLLAIDQRKVEVSFLFPGVYYLKVTDDEGVRVLTFIKL